MFCRSTTVAIFSEINMRFIILFFISIFLLTGCAGEESLPLGHYYQPTASAMPANRGRIYIFRHSNPNDVYGWNPVYINHQKVASLKQGTYTTILMPPGLYTIALSRRKHWYNITNAQTTVNVRSGRSYYVGIYDNVHLKPLLYSSIPTFEPGSTGVQVINLTKNDALGYLSQCRFVKPLINYLR
jgi:hypothetical protein